VTWWTRNSLEPREESDDEEEEPKPEKEKAKIEIDEVDATSKFYFNFPSH